MISKAEMRSTITQQRATITRLQGDLMCLSGNRVAADAVIVKIHDALKLLSDGRTCFSGGAGRCTVHPPYTTLHACKHYIIQTALATTRAHIIQREKEKKGQA